MATPQFGNRAPQDAQAARMMAQVDLSVEPEKPVITLENMFDPETEYEKWLTKLTWNDFQRGVKLRNEFISTLPVLPGPADNSDVIPPGATPESITPPEHWLKVPIHFTPLPDPRHTRPVYLSKQYFTFTRKESVRELFARIYAGQKPKRILDIGTGTGSSAMALAELFPQAEVIGIDLAPHFLRAGQVLARRDNIPNVKFYLQHAANTVFEDESFDIVNESYVLHEMPTAEAQKIVNEVRRIAKKGARVSFVDVIYDDTEEERNARAARGARGPEPFLYDYMKLNIEQYLRLNGFINISTLRDPSWDCMAVTGIKL